jgi:hypothetical protein
MRRQTDAVKKIMHPAPFALHQTSNIWRDHFKKRAA